MTKFGWDTRRRLSAWQAQPMVACGSRSLTILETRSHVPKQKTWFWQPKPAPVCDSGGARICCKSHSIEKDLSREEVRNLIRANVTTSTGRPATRCFFVAWGSRSNKASAVPSSKETTSACCLALSRRSRAKRLRSSEIAISCRLRSRLCSCSAILSRRRVNWAISSPVASPIYLEKSPALHWSVMAEMRLKRVDNPWAKKAPKSAP
jgi:hypothetical protein